MDNVYTTLEPVLLNRKSGRVLQPSRGVPRGASRESARTEPIATLGKIPRLRRFPAVSAPAAESYGWPGGNSSSRRTTEARVVACRLLARRVRKPVASVGEKML